jgi:hypothetical protein
MAETQLTAFLQQIPFLRQVSPEELDGIAEHLDSATFEEGEVIVQAGSSINALYFIFDGEIEARSTHPHRKTTTTTILRKGDTLGEVELIYGKNWTRDLRVKEKVTLYRWQLSKIDPFLKNHPAAFSQLKTTARSRYLAHRLHFKWLGEAETIQGLARKHPFMLVRSLIFPLVFLGGSLALLFGAIAGDGSFLGWLGAAIAMISLAIGIWRWVDWQNDYYIITNRRAVWLEKVVAIYDRRQETPLHWVLSVSVSTNVLGRTFGFGDVIIRTYTGQLIFRNVGDPNALAVIIQEHWRRMKERHLQSDREEMIRALQERLGEEGEFDEMDELPLTSEEKQDELLQDELLRDPASTIGLNHWTLKMRFEEDGVITYRKHWAVLLQQVFVPTFYLLLLLVLFGMRLVGFLDVFSAGQLLLASAIGMILILWWIYRFVDWANDIYQITPTQIVDVNKKPLSRETRKVAPLENILGTEIDRQGIVGLVLNFGSVIANIGTAQFSFHGVYDPASIQQEIVRAQDSFLERQADSERLQRREEVVEWLSAYHEEVSKTKEEPPEELEVE